MGYGIATAAGIQGGQATLESILQARYAATVAAQLHAEKQQQQATENARASRALDIQEHGQQPKPRTDPYVVDGSLVSPSGGVLYTAPPKPTAGGRLVTVNQGGRPVLTPESQAAGLEAYQKPEAAPKERAPHRVVQQGIGPDGKPALLSVDLDTGQAQPVQMPGGFQPNRPAKPVTGAERQTLAFYNRMKDAVDTLEKSDNGQPSLEDQYAGQSLPAQMQAAHAPNMLQTAMQQQYRQAQRAYTEARLRKESGAAIPESEFQNDARTYFAQPGDSPEVKKQKAAARKKVIEGLKFGSGGAYDEFYGEHGGAQAAPTNNDPLGIR